MLQKREVWIDYTKLFACILVVVGHFYQSMIVSKIIPVNDFYKWFNQTIYFFHVSLFFICSGYLYQKFCVVNNFKSWKANILKKFLVLGVPYFVFSTVTWVLKNIFSGSVNNVLDIPLWKVLFIEPTAPYWYLYALFFIFLVIPTFNYNKIVYRWVIVISLLLKIVYVFGFTTSFAPINYISSQSIWFVIGMILNKIDFRQKDSKKHLIFGIGFSVLFLILSIIIYILKIEHNMIGFILGLMACFGIILIIINLSKENKLNKFVKFSAKYTMPIYLMHTIFAASFRSVLFKVGITNSIIHIVLGLGISFVGPVIISNIMCKFKILEILLYPNKIIRK